MLGFENTGELNLNALRIFGNKQIPPQALEAAQAPLALGAGPRAHLASALRYRSVSDNAVTDLKS